MRKQLDDTEEEKEANVHEHTMSKHQDDTTQYGRVTSHDTAKHGHFNQREGPVYPPVWSSHLIRCHQYDKVRETT